MRSETGLLRTYLNWIPILMFHEVVLDGTDPIPPYAVSQAQLRTILHDFARRGYTSGTLDQVVGGPVDDRKKQDTDDVTNKPRKQIVLTFDDGTSDFLENALPVLQEFRFTATIFAIAGMVGGKREWNSLPGQAPLTPVPLMSIADLRALRDKGFTIGSHTISHPRLTDLNIEQAEKEVANSRAMLVNMLGEPVRWFAYPYLAANEVTRNLVRAAGFVGACGGPNQKHSRFYLNRLDASYYKIPQLRIRCNGLFHMTRQMLRQARHSVSGTPTLT